MTETIDDYDKNLAKKDEIIKSREEELEHKEALLKLHKNKRKREDSASPEGVWKVVIDQLVTRHTRLKNENLRLQERLEEEPGTPEAGGESVAEC